LFIIIFLNGNCKAGDWEAQGVGARGDEPEDRPDIENAPSEVILRIQ